MNNTVDGAVVLFYDLYLITNNVSSSCLKIHPLVPLSWGEGGEIEFSPSPGVIAFQNLPCSNYYFRKLIRVLI